MEMIDREADGSDSLEVGRHLAAAARTMASHQLTAPRAS